MNTIEQYIEKTEEKGLLLNEYQKTLVYRCALIGMTEDQMDLFVAAGRSYRRISIPYFVT